MRRLSAGLSVAGALGLVALAVAGALSGSPQRLPGRAPAAEGLAVGRFAGKFELAPLFNRGHAPHLSNGHQEYAERDAWAFMRPNGEIILVRAGRVTDGASIPRFLWSLGFPPDGAWLQAAGGHDECYKSRGFAPADRTRATPYARAECDQLLEEMMAALKVPPWKRLVIYAGVRVGGGAGWGR